MSSDLRLVQGMARAPDPPLPYGHTLHWRGASRPLLKFAGVLTSPTPIRIEAYYAPPASLNNRSAAHVTHDSQLCS